MIKRAFFVTMMSAVAFTAAVADVPLDQCSQIEKSKTSPISPFEGMILLKSPILKNIRLYGMYASDGKEIKEDFPPHPAFVRKDRPELLKYNVPLDPIAALAQYLFPSVDGAILTHNERSGDFWGFIARSQKNGKKGVGFINDLLKQLMGTDGPLSEKVLKGEEKVVENKLKAVVNDWVDQVNGRYTQDGAQAAERETRREQIVKVKAVLFEALKTSGSFLLEEKNADYPPNTALHMLVAFAFRIADSAEEFSQLDTLVQLNIRAPLFSKNAYEEGINDFKAKFASKDSASLSSKEIFLFAQGYETYTSIVPELVFYENTTYTLPPAAGRKEGASIEYPDCGETSLLNFFRIVLGKEGAFSPKYVKALEEKLKLSDQEKTKAHQAFLTFLKDRPDFSQAFTTKGHGAWSQVVSNLNKESSGNKIFYGTSKKPKDEPICNIKGYAGIINILSVIDKLIPHPQLTTKWTEKPEILKKALNGKEKLTEDEKDELKLVLAKAANKLTLLCQLFSREDFELDWSCEDEKILPAITGIHISFTINDKPAFTWEFMSSHFEIRDEENNNNNWKQAVSFENIHLKDSPLLQSFFINPSDADSLHSTANRPVHHFHLWGLSMSDMNVSSLIIKNVLDRIRYNTRENIFHQVNSIVGKVFPEGDREAQSKLLRVLNLLSKKLIRQVPLLNQVQQGTLLVTAVRKGDGKGVQELLEQKAPVDFKDDEGETPLHWAATKNNAEIAKLLIDNKASVDANTYFQDTPLHMAARSGSKDVAALLLGEGASVNVKNVPRKETPLHCAADHGHAAVAHILLKYNASLDVKNRYGKTPLDVAKDQKHEHIAQLLKEHAEKQKAGHESP